MVQYKHKFIFTLYYIIHHIATDKYYYNFLLEMHGINTSFTISNYCIL